METETKDQLKEDVAAVRGFIEGFKDKEHDPLREEAERLSAQTEESMRASKRAAVTWQAGSTTSGARVSSSGNLSQISRRHQSEPYPQRSSYFQEWVRTDGRAESTSMDGRRPDGCGH